MGPSKKEIGIVLSDDRLVMLDDMLCKHSNRLVDSIPIDKEHIFDKKPSTCPHCHSKGINGIYIMGAYSDSLLWECKECESIFLRFKEEKTEGYLQKAKGAWTNKSDWKFVPKSEFN
jgi:hypothetical protein